MLNVENQRFSEAYGCTPFDCFNRLKAAHFNQYVKLQLKIQGFKDVSVPLIELIQTERYKRGAEKRRKDTVKLMGREWYQKHLNELVDKKLKLIEQLAINEIEFSELYDSIDWSEFGRSVLG